MLTKLKREDCLLNYPKFPRREYNPSTDDYDFQYPEIYAGYVLTVSSKSYTGHIKLLGNEIANLAKTLNLDSLIFSGDEKTPWLYRNSEYPPAKKGLHYLVENKIGKRFNGALIATIDDLPEFIKHLCWLTRSNTILPYVYFSDKGQNFMGHICQYGNLHLDAMNAKTDQLLKKIIKKSRFENLKDKRCYFKYSGSGAIKGRTLIM